MSSTPFTILITGASSGIGAALAREYAAPGVRLLLVGRNIQRLEQVAAECRESGAAVVVQCLDLGRADTPELIRQLCAGEILDLVIASAGLNSAVSSSGMEEWQAAADVIRVNMLGSMATVYGALPFMRRGGRIALLSSLAAWHGLPYTPAYSASKAALRCYGEALQGNLELQEIGVSVVMPGCVESPMCSANPGPKPFLWPVDRAARHIRMRLERGERRIAFPWLLDLGCRALAVMPACISRRLLKVLGYGG